MGRPSTPAIRALPLCAALLALPGCGGASDSVGTVRPPALLPLADVAIPRTGTVSSRVVLASRYDDYGTALACGGRLTVDRQGVANKKLPCGTLVTITYRGRSVRVPVIDRGPYFASREFDLTGATADALGFSGVHRVRVTR